MKQKRYWLRGLIVGLVVYVVLAVILFSLTFSGVITCVVFATDGTVVKDSFLCAPTVYLVGLPLMIAAEFGEDISHGTITHAGLYAGLLGGIVVYFGLFTLLGVWYGKRNNR